MPTAFNHAPPYCRYHPPGAWAARAQELLAQKAAAAADRAARRTRAAKPGHQHVMEALREDPDPVDLTSGSPKNKRKRRASARDGKAPATPMDEALEDPPVLTRPLLTNPMLTITPAPTSTSHFYGVSTTGARDSAASDSPQPPLSFALDGSDDDGEQVQGGSAPPEVGSEDDHLPMSR